MAVFFFERTLKVDDPVGAISVHGVNGAWGVLSLGLFADGTYGDGWNGVAGHGQGPVLRRRQASSWRSASASLTCFVFVFVAFYVFFKVLDKIIGNRVSAETELLGLDMPEMGALAYPEFSDDHERQLGVAGPVREEGRWPEPSADPAGRRGHGAPLRCPVENEPRSDRIMSSRSRRLSRRTLAVAALLVARAAPAAARSRQAAPTRPRRPRRPRRRPEPSKIDVGGYVDTYYGYNFNKVDPLLPHLRRAAQHVLAERGRGELRQGADRRQPGRLPRRLWFGKAADLTAAYEPASDGKEIYKHVQQAYVSLLTGKVQWDVGKFVTPMGAEVIESQDNWNYTRSILFGYAIPFYHVGLRATYAVDRQGRRSARSW